MQESCPNCGHRLVNYRVDRQHAGGRDVILRWSICEHCRHVGLREWQFGDADVVTETMPVQGEQQAQEADRVSQGNHRAAG
jgi:endogenous inhibitor of DNA gyrase (YacG/DUF329 family)